MFVRHFLSRFRLPSNQLISDVSPISNALSRRLFCDQTPVTKSNEPTVNDEVLDKLYKTIEVEVRGHDNAVLKSYQMFSQLAAREFGILVGKCWEPAKHIQRRTLLRAAFVKKKYRVQYEWRTHFRVMQFHRMTGSTADTFLEYIERNLPEGVAMKVNKTAVEKLPPHIVAPEGADLSKEQQ